MFLTLKSWHSFLPPEASLESVWESDRERVSTNLSLIREQCIGTIFSLPLFFASFFIFLSLCLVFVWTAVFGIAVYQLHIAQYMHAGYYYKIFKQSFKHYSILKRFLNSSMPHCLYAILYICVLCLLLALIVGKM